MHCLSENPVILRSNSSGTEQNSSEDEREEIYNYGQSTAADDSKSESSDTDSDSADSDDYFMVDRQTTEDYSAYRTRIFDFTRKGKSFKNQNPKF